jgi:ribosomal protein S18 acetylase RimI-like enzyme
MPDIPPRDTHLRAATPADHPAMLTLWHTCGLHPGASDTPEGLARKFARDPELFLVAESAGTLVGTVMGSYDGRRGWINRLAVAPEHRATGLAGRLMAEVERRLAALGCVKVNLLIEPDNASVQGFYERRGYTTKPLIFMEKPLA